jgi:hypothetical protein
LWERGSFRHEQLPLQHVQLAQAWLKRGREGEREREREGEKERKKDRERDRRRGKEGQI